MRPTRGRVSVVLLDALGTLVALERPAPLLRQQLSDRFGLTVSEAEAERAIVSEIGFYREHLDEGRDQESLADLRRRCAGALASALPGGGVLELGALTEALLVSLRFTAFDDVPGALRALRAAGVGRFVVSNWDVSLHAVLARLGLTPLLDGILTSAEAGVRKPAPEIFARALQLAGAGPDQAVHVGDSLEEDVAGAGSAGVQPILLRRDGTPGPDGVRTIASLSELLQLTP